MGQWDIGIYRNISEYHKEILRIGVVPWLFDRLQTALSSLPPAAEALDSNYSSERGGWGFWSSCYEANEEDSDAEVGNRTLLSSQLVFFWLRRISWCSMLLYWLNQLGVGRKPSFFMRYTPANNILELKQSALNSKLNLVQPSKVSGHKHGKKIW